MNEEMVGGMPSSKDYAELVQLQAPFVSGAAAHAHELGHLLRESIAYLEGEETRDQHGVGAGPRPAAASVEDLRRHLRALLTVRPARPLPSHVHRWLDAILQHDRHTAAQADAGSLTPVSAEFPATWFRPAASVALWQGDITRLAADAIVNAANAQLLGCFRPFHACIDNAIHWAAGPRLRADCGHIMTAQGHDEHTGAAKITRGYNLPARFVVHTVGPIVRGTVTPEHRRALARCYQSCLDVAAGISGIRTLAFCAISTGVFAFPKAEAAAIAVQAVATWLNERPTAFSRVIFNVFSDEDRDVYAAALRGPRHGAAFSEVRRG